MQNSLQMFYLSFIFVSIFSVVALTKTKKFEQKTRTMKTLKLSLIFISVSIFSIKSLGQGGYSSASVSQIRANGIISLSQVVVEKYMNYHTHNIAMPLGNKEIAKSLTLLPAQNKKESFLNDLEVKRNYTIAMMASYLKSIALNYEKGKPNKAKKQADNCIKEVRSYYAIPKDKNIRRVLKLIEKYRSELNKVLANT